MFVLWALAAVTCLGIAVLTEFWRSERGRIKYIFRIFMGVMLIVTVFTFIIDFTAYLQGGCSITERITVTQTKITNRLDYFMVNGQYWSVGGHFARKNMITLEKPAYTEIRTVDLDTLIKKEKMTLFYLPVTKFLIRMEAEITDGNSEKKQYEVFSAGDAAHENRCMFYFFVFCFMILLLPNSKRDF